MMVEGTRKKGTEGKKSKVEGEGGKRRKKGRKEGAEADEKKKVKE